MEQDKKFWFVVPAAGVGKRMEADRPKQYLDIGGMTVIERTLITMLDNYAISGGVVVVSKYDEYWRDLGFTHNKTLLVADGGKERSDSVLNGLNKLQTIADPQDWVMVHDAARPLVDAGDILRLALEGAGSDNGAILGCKVRDTIKLCDENGYIEKTVPRENLWHALTPQMFRMDLLQEAIESAHDSGRAITDDASAMELAGYKPQMIESNPNNIKITTAADLEFVKQMMQR
ncbi:MAG: 2-C-methyl-D-erythritol 4-phosphate cytidylyltransferase [Gammaproteobacteria bacterium]|nr:MAG: 2-C-methyl-D-erythritol 4-phosphate cytidylyltransferase [Gammaproteobacteria bacterium]